MRSDVLIGARDPTLVAASTSSMASSGFRVRDWAQVGYEGGGEPGLALIRLLPTDMMERAIINTFVGHDVVEPGNYVQMFPYPCYTRDE